jgi:transcriptional regulator with PAS, ATPase and Fis domain
MNDETGRGDAVGTEELARLGATGVAIARTRLPVLFMGETGTGKSRLARLVHQALTPAAPFVEVNAASLSGALLCSELFGHERGAFTGAHAGKPGLVAAAHGGVLFLDEIGELSPDAQAQLLTFLDVGQYRPVGGVREQFSDARIFAATNRDLAAAVERGRFREDLYYRLASIVVTLPSLRDRPERIDELCARLVEDCARRTGAPPPVLGDDVRRLLRSFDWHGNVRQLRFVIERLVAAHAGRAPSEAEVREIVQSSTLRSVGSPPEIKSLAEMERELVKQALVRTGGNRTRAAELLGITPRGLYNKLRRAGAAAGGDGE